MSTLTDDVTHNLDSCESRASDRHSRGKLAAIRGHFAEVKNRRAGELGRRGCPWERFTRDSKRGSLRAEISDFVRRRLSQYAYPRKVEFVDDLPKTLTGKIRRIELREREQQLAHATPP